MSNGSKLSITFVTDPVAYYDLSSDELVKLVKTIECTPVAPNTYKVEDLAALQDAYSKICNE